MYKMILKVLFLFKPEFIHEVTLFFLSLPIPLHLLFFRRPKIKIRKNERSPYAIDCGGAHWEFPIGIAAGLDKNGVALPFFSKLRFGSVEVGTVTPYPQAGNPKPRIFRHKKEKSLQNFMGFPNDGAEIIVERLRDAQVHLTLGVNLGKSNNVSDSEMASKEYVALYRTFSQVADYLVINLSCPNVSGIKKEMNEEYLNSLLNSVVEEARRGGVPLFLKIAPDLSEESLLALVDYAEKNKDSVSGFVATNTLPIPERGKGGFSGEILYEQSKEVRDKLLELVREKDLSVIGCGGFSNFAQIRDFIKRGGKTVQIYTSFIYQGPSILYRIERELKEDMERLQVSNYTDYRKKLMSEEL